MDALREYFGIVVSDGDWLNDWLTHLPEFLRPIVAMVGYLLSLILGS